MDFIRMEQASEKETFSSLKTCYHDKKVNSFITWDKKKIILDNRKH